MSRNGFTLLEVMAAVALLAVSVSALGLSLHTGWESTRRAMLKSKGEALLSLALCEINDPLVGRQGEFADLAAGGWEYTVEPYLEAQELYLGKLKVWWQEGGKRQSESCAFLTCPEGLYPP